MRKIVKIVLISFVIPFSYSCDEEKKELKKLPEETQVGLNTFGCLLNGDAWVGYVNFAWWNGGKDVEIDISNDSPTKLTVVGNYRPHPDDGNDESIYLSIENFLGVGLYPLANLQDYQSAYYPDLTTPTLNPIKYNLSNGTNSYLNITKYDTLNKIISGTFEMHVENHAITCGRFDATFF